MRAVTFSFGLSSEVLGPRLIIEGKADGVPSDFDITIEAIRFPKSELNLLELLECVMTTGAIPAITALEQDIRPRIAADWRE